MYLYLTMIGTNLRARKKEPRENTCAFRKDGNWAHMSIGLKQHRPTPSPQHMCPLRTWNWIGPSWDIEIGCKDTVCMGFQRQHEKKKNVKYLTLLKLYWNHNFVYMGLGFLGGSGINNLPANAGDMGSISGPRRSLGEGNDYPLQYFCLGNPINRGAWRYVKESDTASGPSNNNFS